MDKEEKDYLIKYGSLGNNKEENLKLLDILIPCDNNTLYNYRKKILELDWKELKYTLFIFPKPSPRPRYSTKLKGFYVKGAKKNQKIIRELISVNNIIHTKTKLIIEIYQPTPVLSMNNYEIHLAEEGYINPMTDPDWDNLGKTYSDMIQGYLIINDNIIIDGEVKKYYSIKPRINIIIQYQNGYDSEFNKKKMESSKLFKELILNKEEEYNYE